jgi:hypothetical protein
MRLTRHREEFNLGMSSADVNILALLLKGYQEVLKYLEDDAQAPNMMNYLQEFIDELTKYQREAEAYDRYLEKEHV